MVNETATSRHNHRGCGFTVEIRKARLAWSRSSRKAKTKALFFIVPWLAYVALSIATLEVGPLSLLGLNMWLLWSLYKTVEKSYPVLFDLSESSENDQAPSQA